MPAKHKRAMSSGIDAPQQGIWSYFNSSSPSKSAATRNRRASSASLPKHSSTAPFGSYNDNLAGHNVAYATQNSWMNHGQRARYIKAGGLIAFVILLFYFFAPGEQISSLSDHALSSETKSSALGQTASDPSVGTTRCTRSSSADKPLIQYALMVDAGSTGSRIHVYRFNNCGSTPELEDEIFEQTAKKEGGSGLSSYREDAEGAAKSLDVLLEVAMKNVPDKLKGCTPIAVKATAGLRKLGPEMSDKILEAVRNRLENHYPFPVLSAAKGGVEVMDGKDEGVYAWITANYLLGKIGGPDKTPTAAVFDLGGGSTQIVFEPNFENKKGGGMPEVLAEGDHKYDMDFGGRKFTLYQHSYLGYGLMAARENLHKLVVENTYAEHGSSDKSWLNAPIQNPCIAPGLSRNVTVELGPSHSLGEKVKVEMVGPKEASTAQCRALAEQTLHKEKTCTLAPCAFDGIHQPALSKVFAKEEVFLFSYFYDRIKPLGMPESFTLKELKDLTAKVCGGAKAWDVFKSIEGAGEELERPEGCLDLNFMLALLHTGYEMPIEREVRIAKKIKGNELGWCLGASLPLLSQESGWSCKIKEVS